DGGDFWVEDDAPPNEVFGSSVLMINLRSLTFNTIERTYTINAPGMGSATGRRSWKKPRGGSEDSKKSDKSVKTARTATTPPPPGQKQVPTKSPKRAKSGQSPTENLCWVFPCGGAPPSPEKSGTTLQQRRAADSCSDVPNSLAEQQEPTTKAK
ncbi:hypothetical protein GCK32_006641, partial [Trichostrongylus colubriformis]